MNSREAFRNYLKTGARIGEPMEKTFRAGFQAAITAQQQDHIGDGNEMAKHQPCGCVICTCEHETQCQGCGAKHCGTHEVGNIPNPVYLQSQAQQPNAWQQAIDDELVNAHLGIAKDGVTREEAKAELNKLIAWHIDAAKYFESQAQQESQWFPIETAPKNKKIIVTYKNALGKNRTVFAKYIEKFTEESTCDTECETDYCEDDDTFYLKEGWVELIDNWDEFSSVYFDSQNVPTHWMDIPPAPEVCSEEMSIGTAREIARTALASQKDHIPDVGKMVQSQAQQSRWIIPTESQIIAATEKAGLWPNSVYHWLPAFHRYHAELAKLPPAPEGDKT